MIAYFISLEAGLNSDRIVNNFYAALFHDIPEALSGDIISPIKEDADEIKALISKEERKLCDEHIFSKIPDKWIEDFRFITGQILKPGENEIHKNQLDVSDFDYKEQNKTYEEIGGEFTNRIFVDGVYTIIPRGKNEKDDIEFMGKYKELNGVDGKLIRVCDGISAFMEAIMSKQHGIFSAQLATGLANIKTAHYNKYIYDSFVRDFFDLAPY